MIRATTAALDTIMAKARRPKSNRPGGLMANLAVDGGDLLAIVSWGAVASLAVVMAAAAWTLTGGARHANPLIASSPLPPDPVITGSISAKTRAVDLSRPFGPDGSVPTAPAELAQLRLQMISLKRALYTLTERHDRALVRIETLESGARARPAEVPKSASGTKVRDKSRWVTTRVVPMKLESDDDDALAIDDRTAKPVPKSRFGLDLGVFASMPKLQETWLSRKKTYSNILSNLRVLTKYSKVSGVTRAHLIAGPFDNAADAIQACVKLKIAGVACKPTHFEGEVLAVK